MCTNCQLIENNCDKNNISRLDIISIVNFLKLKFAKGEIIILEPDEEFQQTESDLQKLSEHPPFPDILFFKMKCPICHNKYRIFIDWYHVQGEIKLN